MAEELSEISKFVSSYWNYYLELEEAFKQTQKYVALDRHNDCTYSVEYLRQIQAVCSEIDVVAKDVAEHFEPGFSKSKSQYIGHWGCVICNNMPELTKTRVYFSEDYVVEPWENFGYMKYYDKKGVMRYKLLPGCNTPSWWSDYNKIKHKRTSTSEDGEINFVKANFKNMVLSLAALFSLEWCYMSKIPSDFGPYIEESKVFSLTPYDSFVCI